MVWGQDKAQASGAQGGITPVLSIPKSRAVILLGINPTVCLTLQHVISQVSQSEAAFQEFSRDWLIPTLCEQSQQGEKGTGTAQATQ